MQEFRAIVVHSDGQRVLFATTRQFRVWSIADDRQLVHEKWPHLQLPRLRAVNWFADRLVGLTGARGEIQLLEVRLRGSFESLAARVDRGLTDKPLQAPPVASVVKLQASDSIFATGLRWRFATLLHNDETITLVDFAQCLGAAGGETAAGGAEATTAEDEKRELVMEVFG